jgi:hypothetical protein
MAGLLDMAGASAAKEAAKMFMVGKPEGLIEAGNIDILSRPQVKLPDGKVATVHTMSFYDKKNGYEVLVPMISPDGKMMSHDEARDFYKKTGQHLGKFETPDLATQYAHKLHEQQAEYYGIK